MKNERIKEDQEDEIRALLLGRTVTKVDDDQLLLDDWTHLTIIPNDTGCGGCSNGWYDLTELNDCPVNAITAVEFELGDAEVRGDAFRLFVLAEDQRIKLLQVEGHDNGYYGSGYWIAVERPA
jgi:hypothetical protein